jgi:hypothetical protein
MKKIQTKQAIPNRFSSQFSKKIKLFLFAFFLFVANLSGQDIAGKYEGFAEVQPFGKLPISGEIYQKGAIFSGIIVTPLGNSGIIEGKFANGSLKLTIDADGNDIFLEGAFSEGRFKGKVSGETVNGNFEMNRIGDAPDLNVVFKQSKEKWREDLRFIAEELPKKHKSAFHFVSKVEFEKAVADLDKQIPNLDDTQVIFGFAKLLAMIGDGHTALPWTEIFEAVPIRFFWFGKELRVFRVDKKHAGLAGAKLVKIGGVSVEEIFKRNQSLISQNESPQFVLGANAYQICFPVLLNYLGLTKNSDSAIYEFIDVKGKRTSVSLKAVSNDAKIDWVYPTKRLPLWLQNRDKQLFFKYLPESETVYVQFQSYPRRKEFKKFSDDLFAFIDQNKVKKLVFDLRLNGGGDFTRGRDFFVNPLKERPKLTEKGNLFVIAGRWTYSAGMSNAADFRNDLGAILVGEPTGARPNGYQEVRSFRLPNSRLEVSYSIEFYKFADKDTAGLIPDKLIEPDWKTFQAGRDSALEWVLTYPTVKWASRNK